MSRSRSIFVFSCPQTCLLCSILSSVSPGWRGPRGVWCYSLCFRTSGTNCPRLCRQTLNCPSLSPLALNFCPQARLSTTGGLWESKSKRKTRVWKISFISVSDVTDAFHIRILNVLFSWLFSHFPWFRHYHVYQHTLRCLIFELYRKMSNCLNESFSISKLVVTLNLSVLVKDLYILFTNTGTFSVVR